MTAVGQTALFLDIRHQEKDKLSKKLGLQMVRVEVVELSYRQK